MLPAAFTSRRAAHAGGLLSLLPSPPHPDDPRAPGEPLWQATLFRARWRQPADWVARYEPGRHRLHLDHAVAAREAAPDRTRRAS